MGVECDPQVYSMKFHEPLGLRTVADGGLLNREAGSKKTLERDGEVLGARFDRDVTSGPRAPKCVRLADAKSASIEQRTGLDVDLEASVNRPHAGSRFTVPCRRPPSEPFERPTKDGLELGCDVQKRRQSEATVFELGMRHTEAGRRVGSALVPQQV